MTTILIILFLGLALAALLYLRQPSTVYSAPRERHLPHLPEGLFTWRGFWWGAFLGILGAPYWAMVMFWVWLNQASTNEGDGGEPRSISPPPPADPDMAPLGDPSDPRGEPRPTNWRQPVSSCTPWTRSV